MKDIDIRRSLKRSVLLKYMNDPESRVIDEFNVSLGVVRADIAVVNGHLHAFEIKSERDTLRRLENQIQEYNKFFEFVTIVTCEKFAEKVSSSYPDSCGIMVASKIGEEISFQQVRVPRKNSEIDSISLVKALWKEEIVDVLEAFGYKKGLKSKSKPQLYKILSDTMSQEQLLQEVKGKLKNRLNWRADLPQTQNDDYSPLSSKW